MPLETEDMSRGEHDSGEESSSPSCHTADSCDRDDSQDEEEPQRPLTFEELRAAHLASQRAARRQGRPNLQEEVAQSQRERRKAEDVDRELRELAKRERGDGSGYATSIESSIDGDESDDSVSEEVRLGWGKSEGSDTRSLDGQPPSPPSQRDDASVGDVE